MPSIDGETEIQPVDLIQAQTDGNANFLRAARAGNLDKVLEYLKGSIDINTSNANGLNALHLASKEGHVNVVTELLKRGANVDAATKKGNTALHIASLAGQEEIVKILVQHEASVNVQSQNGFTPLYMAAQENHDNVVRFLLSNGANQSLATEDGFTPLAVALQQGHDKVVTVLLENDTRGKVRLPALHIASKKDDCKAAALLLQNDHNPDVTSKSGFTPLHIAAHYGNESIANLLLQRGADVNYMAKHNITPLHVASKWGKTNMVSLLVEKNASIDSKTRDGLTPLHCAARSGHDQVVDLLLEKGAGMTAKTKNGLAPLHMAAQGDHVDSARILLYHKVPVDDVTMDYLTALHVAAHCGHVRVAKLLLDRKADPNSRALNGFTPLHIACKKNRIKVVELLLKHGASIEATTESGLTPLHVASFMGCMNIVIYLIQHGSNPDVPTVRGETPLHLAARANQIDIIRILLRNGAHVDARAREQQTPLHIAARLGNSDIAALLLQHGAAVDAKTKDMYTALHIASKEEQDDVASVLLEQGADLTATTKKGFTPLHLAAKYGNMKVARLLLQRDAPVDAQGKNGVTPLHVAAHYDHQNVALLLLDKGASPHATAKNGYTPLHISAKKNQMDIATTLLEYGAKSNAESKAGFTPLHLAAQEGHTDMSTLLLEHHAEPNSKAKNGLTPLHLCAQDDRVNVAAILVKSGAEIDPKTKAGYTPLHVACHFGQMNMVRFLLQHGVDVNAVTALGYTPLHQAAQQGHSVIINLLLEHRASPNAVTNQGQTALSIAQRLGYISVVETLKVVTETIITTTTTTITEEKYKVVAPETMQETFMSDSEDEGVGEDTMFGDQSYRYLTVDEMKSLGDDSLPIDPTRDERIESQLMKESMSAPITMEEDQLSPQHVQHSYAQFTENYVPDNIDISRSPIHAGKLKWKTFLVSFMVDARGGAMRGCRHSGVRVIIPPRKAAMPTRITCRYLKKEKLNNPPPLMEGEACASRILEMGPAGAKFLGPVIIEVPHFASLRGKEREITILRSDNGETWREHTLEATEEAVQDVLNESFDGEELNALEDLNTNRITRVLTTDFPKYFAIVSRVRQEVHAIGPEGGMVSSTVVPQVQAVFPEGALTKKIKVGLQAQPIPAELVAKMLGNRVAVSPIVTVEPRRRKFHKPIVLTIPVPQAASKGMLNQYSGDAPTLRLLCSITGGTTRAQWEDVTGSTPLTFVNDCVSFTTTVSARFWLMDCRNISEASKMATELYREAIHVPFMAKFVVFAKRHDPQEARLRVFCMTDDKEEKTLENQEHFVEVAKSRDVEVLESKPQFVEFAGNLVPVTKSGEQLCLVFHAFKENRLPFAVRVRDPHQDPAGRIAFMREAKVSRGEPPQTPICNLNIALPDISKGDSPHDADLLSIEKRYDYLTDVGINKEAIHRAELRLSDIANLLGKDWTMLALQLDVEESDINVIKSEYPDDVVQQAIVMLRLWVQLSGNKATGNTLEKALRKINREDIVNQCIFNVELVTDDVEKAVAKVHLDQSGFDTLKEELGPSREASLRRDTSLDASYDEQDIMKEAESAEDTSSETGSIPERHVHIDRVVIESVADRPTRQEAKIVHEIIKDSVPVSEPLLIETSAKPSAEYAPGDELEAARLAESETWTSQELDRSTPDLLHAGPDVLTHGHPGDKRSSWDDDEEPDRENWGVKTEEWVEKDDDGFITKKVTKIQYSTKDEQDEKKESEVASSKSRKPESVSDEGVVEESIPFHQKKDFFQKLSSPPEGSSSPPKKSSPPSPPVDDKSRSDKFGMPSGKTPSPTATKPEVVGVDSEEMLSFSDRLSGFRKLEEAVLESKEKQITRRSFIESETLGSTVSTTVTSVRVPPTTTEPHRPHEDLPAFKCAEARGDIASKLPEPEVVCAKHDETQRVFEGSLDLTHGIPRTDTTDDFTITTPDLETPIEGPEAAAKSNNQKMIEVTERVAEVASTLASTLEKVEKGKKELHQADSKGKKEGLREDSKESIPPKRPERTKKADAAKPSPTDAPVTKEVTEEMFRDKTEVVQSQMWDVVDADVQGAFLETEAMASDLDQAARKEEKHIIVPEVAPTVTDIKQKIEPMVADSKQQVESTVTDSKQRFESMVSDSKQQVESMATDSKQQVESMVTDSKQQVESMVTDSKQVKSMVTDSKQQVESMTTDSKQQVESMVTDSKQVEPLVTESSKQAEQILEESRRQAETILEESRRQAELILEDSRRQAEPKTPESPVSTRQQSSLEYQASAVSTSGDEDEGRAVKAEIKLLVKTSELGRDAIEIRSIKEFVETDKTDSKKSELSRIFSEAAASDISPPISKMDVDDRGILQRPPTDVPLETEEPKRPMSPVQPYLGSLSIAYEEPPHYQPKDVEAEFVSGPLPAKMQETIPDIMQHLSDKVSPADQRALAEDTDVEDQFTSASPPHDSHIRPPSLTETVLNKLSPIEPTSDMGEVEQEISPAVEFPQKLTPQTQVYVGVSPTEGLAASFTSQDGSEDLQKPLEMLDTLSHDTDRLTTTTAEFDEETQVSGALETLTTFPLTPSQHPLQFQPSAPPQPPDDIADGLILPEMMSSEMSDRSDTESTQTSANTVIQRPEPDLLSGFRDKGDGASMSSLTGFSDREESLDMEFSFKTESMESSKTFRHTIESASSAYSQRTESTESESELSGAQFSHMGFENKAFAGVEHIDDAMAARMTSTSPFELPRDVSPEVPHEQSVEEMQSETTLQESFEKTATQSMEKGALQEQELSFKKEIFKEEMQAGAEEQSTLERKHLSFEERKTTSIEHADKTQQESFEKTTTQSMEKGALQEQELSFKKEIFKEEMKAGAEEQSTLERKHLSFEEHEEAKKQERIDQQIKSEIFSHELEEAIETELPEVTYLSGSSSIDEKSEQFVAKRMKSDIFSQELAQGLDDQSPEQKDLPKFPIHDLPAMVLAQLQPTDHDQEVPVIVTPTRSASEIPTETVLWEVPVQEQTMPDTLETTEEIPAHRQVIFERDEDEDEESEPDTANIEDVERALLAAATDGSDKTDERLSAEEAREIAEGIVEEIKTEVCRRPPLRHIPSEISEEDLVERYGGSPEQDFVVGERSATLGRQMSEDLRAKFITTEASSIDITDEELEASSDELSPVEQHRERLESMTIEENLRRQSFVQLSEEQDLLAETEWKASRWVDTKESGSDDGQQEAMSVASKEAESSKDEGFQLMETTPLVDECFSKDFKEPAGEMLEKSLKSETLQSTRSEKKEQSGQSKEDVKVLKSEEVRESSKFGELHRTVEAGDEGQLTQSVKSMAKEQWSEEHSSKFDTKEKIKHFDEKQECVKVEEKDHSISFEKKDDSSKSEEKDYFSKFEEKDHSRKFEEKDHSRKFEEKDHSIKFEEKDHSSKFEEKDHSSKFDEKVYSQTEKEQSVKFLEREQSSSIGERIQSMTSMEEKSTKFEETEHSSSFEQTLQSVKMQGKETVALEEEEHSFKEQVTSAGKEHSLKEQVTSEFKEHSLKERVSLEEEEHLLKEQVTSEGKEHSFQEHVFVEEMYSLEKDRERRAKQEQEFQEVVKLRRELVEQARSREMDKVEDSDKKEQSGSDTGPMLADQAEGSSGDSHYSSAVESDSRGTPGTSRPCSSDVETLVSGHGSSEYDTCATSEDGTYRTAPTSQEYMTAGSSLSHSSRESMRSIDSESSGHMGSVEVSSEASETLVPSAVELERDTETPTIDDDRYFALEQPVKEPYEMEIPEHVIRGERMLHESIVAESADSAAWETEATPDLGSPFEVIMESELAALKSADEMAGGSASRIPDSTFGDHGFLGGDGARSSMYRQESGAYMAGECVDDLPDHSPGRKDTHGGSLPVCSGGSAVFPGRQDPDFYAHVSPGIFGEIPTIPVASAPPAEEDEDAPVSGSGASGYMPDIYSQANGPVEVEFFPEYDAGPDDGYVAEPTGEVVPGATREEGVCDGHSQPDIVPVHQFMAPQRSDISDEELSDADSDQDVRRIQGHQEHQAFREVAMEEDYRQTDVEEEMVCSGSSKQALSRLELDSDRPDSELRDLDISSRPQSHAESDSEQRPFSELQFSDDRPDSELTELMKQADVSDEREVSEEIERPASPEPLDEYDIREDLEDRKSAEATAPLYRDEVLENYQRELDVASPREKHEYETSEWSAKEKSPAVLAIDIPDITVTQHITPMVDQRYHEFPDDKEYDAAPDIKKSDVPKPSAPDSEDSSDSFEMVEKNELPADEDPPKETSDDGPPILFSSVSVKPLGVHFYPADDAQEIRPEDTGSYEKGEYEEQEKEGGKSGEGSPLKEEAEIDAEKWMEMQFEGAGSAHQGAESSGYLYQMDFEREYDERAEFYPRDEELEDIAEEGEKQDEEDDEKVELGRLKTESKSSTPEYDFLAGRRFFSKSGENDDVSMSSLQEFERIEAELARGDRRLSSGSQESLNGKKAASRSSQGDDGSVTSLQEFERLERECADAEKIERIAREEAARLSEIEEGHESQASEAESQETLSEHGGDDDTDSDDYEKRMFEIDEIIKQAQSNVEQFVEDKEPAGDKPPPEEKSKVDSGSTESGGDATESSLVDKTPSPGEEEDDADSLDGDVPAHVQMLLQQESKGTAYGFVERQADASATGFRDGSSTTEGDSGKKCTDVDDKDDCDSDSLQEDVGLGAVGREFDRDSLGGSVHKTGKRGGADTMASSTDSLEPSSSTATHATYQYETDSIMSSSFTSMQTSGEESTMVSSTDTFDLEHRNNQGPGAATPPDVRYEDGKHVYIEQETLKQFMDLEGNLQTDQNAFQKTSPGQETRTITDTEGNLQTLTTFGDFGTGFGTSTRRDSRGRDDPFAHTIHRSVMLEPEVRTVTFAGPDAETKMKEFIAKFQPGDDVVEMETTDDMGNVHVTRTVQHRIIMQPQMTTVSFTGQEAERKIQEYLSQASAEMPDFEGAFVERLGEGQQAGEVETETFETTDEFGNVRRVIRKKSVQPSVETVSFSGPNAQREMEDFLRQTIEGFEPGRVSEEVTSRDQQGNAMKVVKHVVSTSDPKPKTETKVHSTPSDIPTPKKGTKTVTVKALPPESGSPRKSPLLRDSPPSSPTVSSSSHSEDCYCGPEAESSAHSASVGPHRPEIEELETESWDPQRRAEFYSEEGDYGVEEEDEELPPATATATRTVTHEVRRTVRGPDGKEITVVETEESFEDHPSIEQLRQSRQAASSQIVELDEDSDSQHHHHHQDS